MSKEKQNNTEVKKANKLKVLLVALLTVAVIAGIALGTMKPIVVEQKNVIEAKDAEVTKFEFKHPETGKTGIYKVQRVGKLELLEILNSTGQDMTKPLISGEDVGLRYALAELDGIELLEVIYQGHVVYIDFDKSHETVGTDLVKKVGWQGNIDKSMVDYLTGAIEADVTEWSTNE